MRRFGWVHRFSPAVVRKEILFLIPSMISFRGEGNDSGCPRMQTQCEGSAVSLVENARNALQVRLLLAFNATTSIVSIPYNQQSPTRGAEGLRETFGAPLLFGMPRAAYTTRFPWRGGLTHTDDAPLESLEQGT